MTLDFKEYTTLNGEVLLYVGAPNFDQLEVLSLGAGDLWHSALDQGFKNIFPEIIYQSATFWYINDIEGVSECISWRFNPSAFVVRKKVWEFCGGFDQCYQSEVMKALDYGYNSLCYRGIVPMYVRGLFPEHTALLDLKIPVYDVFAFYFKNFKKSHANYVLYRLGFMKPRILKAYFSAKRTIKHKEKEPLFPPRNLNTIEGQPTVSYIIPTMLRQEFTLNLLRDLVSQTYAVSQVIVVDATPESHRNLVLYDANNYPFNVHFVWQQSKGSCRARNEAIDLCTGDYIVFGDDDVRIPNDFIENHVRLLQTYKAGACNGLDIRADHQQQDLVDLQEKLAGIEDTRWRVGATNSFSNANSCVQSKYVRQLVGNDINYDGGYGEDSDFGQSLIKIGVTVLHNPFSANLHLKPAVGGYRFWGLQAKVTGKKRKAQPWELDTPVTFIRPVPSPTIMYQLLKQFELPQFKEYQHKYFVMYVLRGVRWQLPLRLVQLPYRYLQFKKSVFYARKLILLGKRVH